MSATACIQILVSQNRAPASGFDVLDTVAKVTKAFLESRWSWPRSFASASQTCYLLSDPRASALDPVEIQELSNKLQLRLFGVSESGDVAIAAFEGPADEVAQFSSLKAPEINILLNGGVITGLNFRGKLTKLTPRAAQILQETNAPEELAVAAPPPETKLLYRGIYLAAKHEFIGSLVSRWRSDDQRKESLLNGYENFPLTDPESFDRETILALAAALTKGPAPTGIVVTPLSYTALARLNMRERYVNHLKPLAGLPKERLMARIYDVPREPQLTVLTQMKSFLQDYFALVDLAVADPGVDIGAMGAGIARGVTLVLPSADDLVRQNAIRRFMSNRERFRHQGLWPGIDNIRSRHEIQICAAAKVAFISGPAVTGILEQPVGLLPFMIDGLPLTAEGL